MVARDYEAPADANTDNVYEIEITATDEDSNSDAESWTVAVNEIYVAPIAHNDNITTNEDQAFNLNILDIVDNPDNEILTVNHVDQFSYHGTGTLTENGELTYIPDNNYYGNDSKFYSVCIEGTTGYCDTAKIGITIEPVNDSPVAENVTLNIYEHGLTDICITVTDVESDECTLTEIIDINETFFSTYSNDQLCFEYDASAFYDTEEELNCVVCDNGVPSLCDTATITLIYEVEKLIEPTQGISPNGDNINDYLENKRYSKFPK